MDLILKEKLASSLSSDNYIGHLSADDDTTLRLKVIKPQFFSEQLLEYTQQQLSYLERLEIRGVAIPTIHPYKDTFVLAQPFIKGIPLSQALEDKKKLKIEETLLLGITLCEQLESRHQKTWVHKGVTPNNIIISTNTDTAKLIDDIRLLSTNQLSHSIDDPRYCKTILPYQSPEQSGRIKLEIDYRSDLYSLGCILFHCIAGRPPFDSNDPLNIIHSHLAETPIALISLQPNCPASLSNIVETLLEKQAENRYQTAAGLGKDLSLSLERLKQGNAKVFQLKRYDLKKEIALPSIMVGRETEKLQLLENYQNVCRGNLGVAYISGVSGIGKSRLIQELEVPILIQHGFFTSGKYNQFSKHQPYNTLTQAIGGLIRQLLTEPQQQLEYWKNDILDVVGLNGQLLTALIPELSLLIGSQPDVAPLPPMEARNRFNGLFCRFLSCLATKEHPLVLFIDDLQWCDDATLDLLDLILENYQDHPYIFLILAYRSNEVSAQHRVTQSKKQLITKGLPFLDMELPELDEVDVNDMTAYILGCQPAEATEITEAIFPTSGGNPLLVSESLRWLHQRNAIRFGKDGLWHWEAEELKDFVLPDSGVTLFADRLTLLPLDEQEILAKAALLGARFKIEDFSTLLRLPIHVLLTTLENVFSQRILLREQSELYFFHDQVQSAAAKLINNEKSRTTHKEIALLYIKQYTESQSKGGDKDNAQLLYAIAEHLKQARLKQPNKLDRFQEANYNYLAGMAALNTLAHKAAHYYFKESLDLCEQKDWEKHYSFMLNLHKSLAHSSLLVGKQEYSREIISKALTNSNSDIDQASCLLEQTRALASLGKIEEALALAKNCCNLLDRPVPEEEQALQSEIGDLGACLEQESFIEKISNITITSDPRIKIELDLYAEFLAPSYLSGQLNLFFLAGLRAVKLAVEKGKSNSTGFPLGTASVYFYFAQNFKISQRYESLTLQEAESHPYEFSTIRAITQGIWLTFHHTRSIGELQKICRKNIDNGVKAGELNYSGLSYMPLIWYQLAKGEDIAKLQEQIDEGLHFCAQYNISMPLEICRGIKLALSPLWGKENKEDHQSQIKQQLHQWHKEQHLGAIANFFCYQAMLFYYAENYEEAEQSLLEAQPYLAALPSTIIEKLWVVYRYLIGLHTYNNPESQGQIELVKSWAENGPIMQPYLAKMEAETIASTSNSIQEVRNCYLQAVDICNESGYYFQVAFLYQRLGSWLENRNHHSSDVFLKEAISLYKKCHADMFIEALATRFQINPERIKNDSSRPNKAVMDSSLDSAFLIEASQNIIEERDYSALLIKILSSMMARVGAKNGYLITVENDTFTVQAHSRKNAELVTALESQEAGTAENICIEIVRYAVRTRSPVILNNAMHSGDFTHTGSVRHYRLKSVLVLPLITKQHTLGVVYLENSLIPGIFSPEQVSILSVLTAQAAIALDNSLLINHLQNTQRDLIQREQNLSITLNSIGDGVIVTDQAGSVVRLNPIAEKLTGWPIAEAKGMPVRKIFHIIDASTQDSLLNPVDKVLSTGETVYLSNHTTLISRDGQQYQIADSAAPIKDSDDNVLGMVLVFNDVTEAYHLRKEISESHNRLQQVMGDMHSMVATLTPKGTITYINKKPLTLSDLSLENVLNQRFWKCFWFNYDKGVQQAVKQACLDAARGQLINLDLRMQTLNGPIWIEFGLHPVRNEEGEIHLLVWEGRDISSRKQAEQKLKEEQALQELTLDNLADSVIIINQEGIIQSFNAAARKTFGYRENEIVGRNVSILMDEPFASKHDSYLKNYARTSHAKIIGIARELNAKRKNGEVFPFHLSVIELPPSGNQQRRFVGSGIDLTSKKLQQEMLQRSQKMDALGKLTGGIAHDYNNMLGVILGYCELLDPTLDNNTKQKSFLKQIQHAAERGAMLTQKLLAYSRQKPSQYESININKLIIGQQGMLEKTLTARIQLKLDLEDGIENVSVNLGELEDSILNLCINAMHAMPDGGRLTIKTRTQELSTEDSKTLQLEEGWYVVLNISDTGTGMSKDTQSKIFDPFFSTKGEKGTGLGLSQVYGFMERSKGAIKVYSEPGHGSRFSLYFPCSKTIDTRKTKNQKKQEQLSGSENILIVDDEIALLELTREILENQGYTVYCAKNGKEAVSILKNHHIQLVLSDVIMPEMNGYRLAKYIRQYDPNIKIQLMSGFDDEHQFDENNDFLHDTQLTKPIKTRTLLERVRALLNEALEPL